MMKVDIAIDRNSDLHERVKDYARDRGLRMPHAYAELVEEGLEKSDRG